MVVMGEMCGYCQSVTSHVYWHRRWLLQTYCTNTRSLWGKLLYVFLQNFSAGHYLPLFAYTNMLHSPMFCISLVFDFTMVVIHIWSSLFTKMVETHKRKRENTVITKITLTIGNAEHIKQTLSTNKPYCHQQHLPKISQNVSGADI